MKPNLLMAIILPAFAACRQGQDTAEFLAFMPGHNSDNPYPFLQAIPASQGLLSER